MFVGKPTWETIGLGKKKVTNGFLSKSSSTMVLPAGQKTVLGLSHLSLYIYILNCIIRLQAIIKIITFCTQRKQSLDLRDCLQNGTKSLPAIHPIRD
jgi:hypothetical protein